jgi:peptidoglycan/xylan/chitin deacetylase (PgdA/CDA1 family)
MVVATLPSNTGIALCFHGIGPRLRTLQSDEAGYWLSEEQFLRILDEVAEWPQVELSFDDGNASDVAIGLPALRQRGLVAVFYALAGRVDQPGSLTTAELREIVAADMEVGTHGWHHVPWTDLDDAAARLEILDSRLQLSEAAGHEITRAALPLGRYNRRVLARLHQAGYQSVSTSDRALARPGQWLRPRFSVHADDTPESIRETVAAATRSWARYVRSTKSAVKRLR